MTNEEAIEYLKWIRPEKPWSLDKKNTQTAIDKAIKALEQQPCEDCVSRNAISQTLNTMYRYVADELRLCDTDKKFPKNEVFIVDEVYEQIVEQLPSVIPQPKIGKWVSHYDYCKKHELLPSGLVAFWWCNLCEQGVEHPTNFCPRCGAKMFNIQESGDNE